VKYLLLLIIKRLCCVVGVLIIYCVWYYWPSIYYVLCMLCVVVYAIMYDLFIVFFCVLVFVVYVRDFIMRLYVCCVCPCYCMLRVIACALLIFGWKCWRRLLLIYDVYVTVLYVIVCWYCIVLCLLCVCGHLFFLFVCVVCFWYYSVNCNIYCYVSWQWPCCVHYWPMLLYVYYSSVMYITLRLILMLL
jgi:hypothetical protein